MSAMRRAPHILSLLACACGCWSNSASAAGQTLPAEFLDDRITLVVPDAARPPLRFYTDNGGGAGT